MDQVTVNKRNGAQFELDLMRSLRATGYECERLRQAGMRDEGDLVVRHGPLHVVLEAKAPGVRGRTELGPWLAEAEAEGEHYADARLLSSVSVRPFLVIRARGKRPSEAFAVQRIGNLLRWMGEQ